MHGPEFHSLNSGLLRIPNNMSTYVILSSAMTKNLSIFTCISFWFRMTSPSFHARCFILI